MVISSGTDLGSIGGAEAGEDEGADVHAVLGEAGEAAEHPQRELPGPRGPRRAVRRRDLPEYLVGLRAGPRGALGREEGADDAGPDGVVGGGPELGGEAEEHGLSEDAGLGGQDAERGGHRRGDGGARGEVADARGGGLEGLEARAWREGSRGEALGGGAEKKRVGWSRGLPRWRERSPLSRSMLQSMAEAAGMLSIAAAAAVAGGFGAPPFELI